MKEKSVDISLVIQIKNQKGICFVVLLIVQESFENGETSGSEASQSVEIKEVRVQVL